MLLSLSNHQRFCSRYYVRLGLRTPNRTFASNTNNQKYKVWESGLKLRDVFHVGRTFRLDTKTPGAELPKPKTKGPNY
jgi:hypothetical protein